MPRVRIKKPNPITEKTRAEDEKLKEELRHFDLKKFDKALEKVINPSKKERGQDKNGSRGRQG